MPGDYNGDRLSEPAVWRRSAYGKATWYVGSLTDAIGASGDVPEPGDYNGDGRTDPTVWTPSTGTWTSLDGPNLQFATATDIPLSLPAAIRMTQLKSR